MNIKNIFHEHPLTLRDNNNKNRQLLCHHCSKPLSPGKFGRCINCRRPGKFCYLCDETVSAEDSLYICEPCWPHSPLCHESCVDLPREFQISYYLPCCFFKLINEYQSSELDPLVCDFCKERHWGFRYCCELCDFQIGVGCASKLVKYHQDQQHVEHFSHHHPLTLLKLDDVMNCRLCLKTISDGSSYGCAPCKFYIHSSCRELPQEIKHPFHPRHCLKLSISKKKVKYRCDACLFDIQNLRYRCVKCGFNLHPECTSLKPSVTYKGHPHLLILVENLSHHSNCEACSFDIQGVPFMRCVACHLNFHLQCGPQPLQQTVLVETEESDFDLHPECISLKATIEYKGHEHLLTLIEDMSYNADCEACDRTTYGAFFMRCEECELNFHVQCGPRPLPPTVLDKQHGHLLTLRTETLSENNFDQHHCAVCNEEMNQEDPTYYCADFDYQAHLYDTPTCHGCKLIPPNRDTSLNLDDFYVRCVKCNFNRHLLCCPLPKTIQRDDIHYHRVTIKDNFDDIFDDFDDDEYCCDACETRRQAGECVMQFLEGKCKDVDSRNINREIPRKRRGLSHKDMVESLTEEDKKSLTVLEQQLVEGTKLDMFDELKEINQTVIEALLVKYDEEWLKSTTRAMIHNMIQVDDLVLEDLDVYADEIVNVGAYKISRGYAQVLKNMLDKFGDFGASCPLTQNDSPFFEPRKEIAEHSKEINERKAKIENLKKRAQDSLSSYGSEQLRSEAKRFDQALELKWKSAATGFLDDHEIPKL
ncbi:hypothetical protein CUMW_225880 [Citrus unshiu]|uniref:Phorbol-ester/DAG-type domain-containing protein n=1 Tax=Citrus unshiu TaxID=55188 RepID=A0A2H5QFQ5_CITUN|nr:hypothetical protein CUMW_225880 [Citrus unshiu]